VPANQVLIGWLRVTVFGPAMRGKFWNALRHDALTTVLLTPKKVTDPAGQLMLELIDAVTVKVCELPTDRLLPGGGVLPTNVAVNVAFMLGTVGDVVELPQLVRMGVRQRTPVQRDREESGLFIFGRLASAISLLSWKWPQSRSRRFVLRCIGARRPPHEESLGLRWARFVG
jgi:hypothetical protein